jgi:hypothetical protein
MGQMVPVQPGRPGHLVKDLPLLSLPCPLIALVMRLKNLPPDFHA